MIVFAICCIVGIFSNTLSPSFCSPLFDGELLSDLESLKSGGTNVVYDGTLIILSVFALALAFILVFIFALVLLLLVLERVIPALLSECGLYNKRLIDFQQGVITSDLLWVEELRVLEVVNRFFLACNFSIKILDLSSFPLKNEVRSFGWDEGKFRLGIWSWLLASAVSSSEARVMVLPFDELTSFTGH